MTKNYGSAGIVCCIAVAVAVAAIAAEYRTPAGTRTAKRTEEGAGTILPGGRLLAPFGAQYITGPGPFGLAVNSRGDRVVTANGGPDRYSLSVLEQVDGTWKLRTIGIALRGKPDSDDDWRSTFMGLAFESDRTLFASEGESGQVRVVDVTTGRKISRFDLNGGGFADSYSGDLAFDGRRGLLYVVDQANFRVAIIDTKNRRIIASVRVGRLPFALALAPNGNRLYVTNVGMFEYKPVPGVDPKRARETGLPFPAFGFPSRESRDGAMRTTGAGRRVAVPGLGDPNAPESNSVCVIDVADASKPKVAKFIRTGVAFGANSMGGSSPAGIVATADAVYVSNSTNDSVAVIDPASLVVKTDVPLRIRGLEAFRGVLPVGLAVHPRRNLLFVAEAGINAVGIIDLKSRHVVGHIPAGWFPTRVAVRGDDIYVTNAKGHGIGPNATSASPLPASFQAERRRGSLSRYTMPSAADIPRLTAVVMENNGFSRPVAAAPQLPKAIDHVVIIVKENRTFDEVFGDQKDIRDPAPALARYGRGVTPNHHAIADRFAISDNFYADSEVSVDGHHWLVGSYPNVWTESTLMAAYGGAKTFRLTPNAPGRLAFPESDSSVHPEDQVEAGTLWHHLERHHITFRNFGEGFELAGVDEGQGLKPTGARYITNVPMPDPLYRNTSREYPNYNLNIPDQYRATQFIGEIEALYRKPGKPLPQLLFIHLPQDHTTDAHPAEGYGSRAAYVADNDYALGRILDYLSHTPWWRTMALLVTEDDAQSGVDHVDAHRTVLIVASPYAKKGYVSHENSSFPGLLKTAFRILRIPPLNLYDATARDLSDCFTSTADFTPYTLVPANKAVFDPALVKEPMDPRPSPKMDDPNEVRREHRR